MVQDALFSTPSFQTSPNDAIALEGSTLFLLQNREQVYAVREEDLYEIRFGESALTDASLNSVCEQPEARGPLNNDDSLEAGDELFVTFYRGFSARKRLCRIRKADAPSVSFSKALWMNVGDATPPEMFDHEVFDVQDCRVYLGEGREVRSRSVDRENQRWVHEVGDDVALLIKEEIDRPVKIQSGSFPRQNFRIDVPEEEGSIELACSVRVYPGEVAVWSYGNSDSGESVCHDQVIKALGCDIHIP